MSNYGFIKSNASSQQFPIFGRESEMTKNRAGGYGFSTDLPTRVRRALYFGTTEKAYYAGREELTLDFFQAVMDLSKEDPRQLSELIRIVDKKGNSLMTPTVWRTLILGEAPGGEGVEK